MTDVCLTRTVALVAMVALASSLVPAGRVDAAQWLRLRSPHFVVVGDASERELRRVADRVEGFREGLMRALPNATVAIPVPMTIVVFATDGGFTPYKPLVGGRPMERIAGYFLAGEDANYIAMTLAHGESAYPTILHEYTHALLSETLPAAPMWLHEGLAEVYSTYTERVDGRSALIGGAPAMHLRELQTGVPLPIEQLMTVDVSSAVYNEGERRGMFYAQAWALTHYLLLGNEARRAQLPEFLRLRDQGASVADAIRGAFGCEPKTLENEFKDYGRLFSMKGFEVALDPNRRRQWTLATERVASADAQTYTVELLARLGRIDEARRVIDTVLGANPNLPRGLAALGRLHVRAGRVEDGLPLLRAAAERLPDDAAVTSTYARALVEQLRAQGIEVASRDRDGLERVGRALDLAHRLNPDDVYVVAMQGYVALLEGADFERARALLERAVRLAPARQDYHLLLAQVFIAQRNLSGAQALLGPLVARGADTRTREQARSLLARAADDSSLTPDAITAVGQALALRTLEADESRVLGAFERVECGSEGTVLHIQAGDRTLRVRARRLEDVDLINYRDEPVAPIGCGAPAEALRVVATFRGALDRDAEVVALEFVPSDFMLPEDRERGR